MSGFAIGASVWFGLLMLAALFKPICDNPFVVIVGGIPMAFGFLVMFQIIAEAFGYHLSF